MILFTMSLPSDMVIVLVNLISTSVSTGNSDVAVYLETTEPSVYSAVREIKFVLLFLLQHISESTKDSAIVTNI